ncbi:MAG TPA: DoxX family protein [Chitinophaga sp.]|uniref:DoxX family protein n=1 Tax=Chitinophaga sp. TaxID=1869181 RepID=UPI002DBE3294|nr:DoxX family protein [Chitinophaga sp.]HEU4555849.1 DoxX family protein [Chitinophaga sp.]
MTTGTYSNAYTPPVTRWKEHEKIIFRVIFIYFLVQVIPLDWKFYRQLFAISWLHLQYADIFNIAHYTPALLSGTTSYADWAIFLGVALAGAFIWTIVEKNKQHPANYDALYYWLRALLRYRLAIALLAYGFIKFFPLQSPYPSLSNLNTPYGDFTEWKLFSLTLGIVPGYESFLGLVEIIAALLLLYRKTTTLGAFIVLAFTGNVFMSNLAYGGGENVYSLFLVLIALFLFVHDVPQLTRLLAQGRPAAPVRYRYSFTHAWQRNARLAAKGLVILLFIVVYGVQTYAAAHRAPYQYPADAGLAGAQGLYNVREFRINNQVLPYSDIDPVRWQDVVLEKWNTLSIRSNRPVIIDSTNTDRIPANNSLRTFELHGAAARHYYSYVADTAKHLLVLQNRNPHYKGEQLLLHYERPDSATIILTGVNENKAAVYVVLERVNKKYLLEEVARKGRRRAIKR